MAERSARQGELRSPTAAAESVRAEVPEPDAIVAMRAGRGDRAAFGALYERHSVPVRRYLQSLGLSWEAAEDLCGETFIRALGSIERFEGDNVRGWLFRIARNLFLDHVKSSRYKTERLVGDFWGSSLEVFVGADASPEDALVLKHERWASADAVQTALSALPDDQQRCLYLRYFSGKSLAETAREMSRSEGAVKALHHRAKLAMLEALSVRPERRDPPTGLVSLPLTAFERRPNRDNSRRSAAAS